MKALFNKYVFSLLIVSAACAPQKQIEYNLPVGMTKEGEKSFVIRFNKGKAIYAASCAECHNKTVNGKSIVPDFTSGQMDAYAARLRTHNAAHNKALNPRVISEDDLSCVLYYLTYKKSNVKKQ
jgi:mono/diheme cytochrome c family protein